ncbi:MAG: starch synthase [Euryarchaeota archaeon RBG_16_68_12]|nr:MAG: starch synthase [Euryarchaeota archaeon RBG_16_68_12]
MRVLFATAEAYPLAKVGGLGDVAGSLPKALRALGHDVRIVLPRYGGIRTWEKDLGAFPVTIGGTEHEARVLQASIDGTPVFLVDKPDLFDRPKVYEFPDDGQRFAFFGRAVLDLLPVAGFWPDVVHCNDWHTGLALAFLKTTHAGDERYRRIRGVFTIHNLQHQGLFGRDLFDWAGLPAEAWNMEGVEFFGKLNFLKAGIVHADRVSTVSPTYAKEIQTPAYGYGLDGLLRSRASRLSGILNGIDTETWDPARDAHIPHTYSSKALGGKAKDKAALQAETGLARDAKAPLLGLVTRVTEQKGFDILLPALPEILGLGVQVVLLGTGDKPYMDPLPGLAAAHRGFVAVLKYDEPMAHRIYAGSDFFLMPSKFEPCGLGQEISLRYGTVPIVRATGGLADTVTDVAHDPKAGDGFTFAEFSAPALVAAVRRAVEFYRAGRGWRDLVRRGMARDLSWDASAREYVGLYERAITG